MSISYDFRDDLKLKADWEAFLEVQLKVWEVAWEAKMDTALQAAWEELQVQDNLEAAWADLDFEEELSMCDEDVFEKLKTDKWFFWKTIIKYIRNHEIIERGRKLTHQSFFEILWTIIPAIILIILAIPSLKLLYSLDFLIFEYEPIVTVKVIGHQWYWSYEYIIFSNFNVLDFEVVTFDSYLVPDDELNLDGLRLLEVDNPLVIPGNTYIRFLVTSVDVLHAWAVPSLGIKVDAVPGRLNQVFTFIKRPGDFYGQCSEICGVNHGFMPIRIVSNF